MDIQSAFYSGLQGVQRASSAITEATQDINRQTTSAGVTGAEPAVRSTNEEVKPAGLTTNLVQLNQQEVNAQANVEVINAADEVLGTTIDVRV